MCSVAIWGIFTLQLLSFLNVLSIEFSLFSAGNRYTNCYVSHVVWCCSISTWTSSTECCNEALPSKFSVSISQSVQQWSSREQRSSRRQRSSRGQRSVSSWIYIESSIVPRKRNTAKSE